MDKTKVGEKMIDSRIEKTKKNFIYAVILQITKILFVFINRIIFVKILGPVYLGINGLFSNILSMLSIADLGITTAMMYSLYKPLAEHDEDKISMYIRYFKKMYNVIAVIVFLSGILLIPFLKYMVNLPEEINNIYLYYIILVINTALTYLFVYKTTLLSADQKMYIINKYDTIFQFVLFVLQIIVLLTTKSFSLYLISNLLCTVLGNVCKAKKTDEIYPYLKENKSIISKEEKKEIFTNIKSLFLYKIGGVLQSNTDNILTSIFVGTIVVGYYSNYSTIIITITTFVSLVYTSVKASVGNYVNTQKKEEQLKLFNILEIFNFWIVGFCYICFMELIPPFIEICFGKEYLLSKSVLIWICLNFYTSNIRQTLWAYRETTGMYNNSIKYVTIVTAIINIILSIVLGKYFGLNGILSATVISRMIYAWWKEPKIIFNEYFKKSSKEYFIKYIIRLLYACIIVVIIEFGWKYVKISNIYISFLTKILITAIISSILLILPYVKSDAIIYIKKLVKKGQKNV